MSFRVYALRTLEPQPDVTALALGMTIPGRKAGRAGVIEIEAADGVTLTLGVSRLEGETDWIVDSLSENGLPAYANGVGSRCTALKRLENEKMVAALDAATGEES